MATLDAMERSKLAYAAAIVALIASFNVALVLNIKDGVSILYAAGSLAALVALIVFRRWGEVISKPIRSLFALAIIGVIVTLVSHVLAVTYAVAGLLMLTVLQGKTMISAKGRELATGKFLFHSYEGESKRLASYALAMMLSVALTFFIKVLWVASGI
jgi:hypothetical protein